MRIALSILLFASLGVGACSKDSNNGNPMGPDGDLPTNIVYSAIGASDVAGIGSSAPCFSDCPNAPGYVFVTARGLRDRGHAVTVVNLGIPTAVLSRRIQDLASGIVLGNFIDNEVPLVRTNSDIVTVFAGGNDVNHIVSALGRSPVGTDPVAFIDQQVSLFAADFAALLSGVRARAPNARVVVLNLPNIGALPLLSGAFVQQRQAAQRAAVRITTDVLNPLIAQNVRVVDLMCEPRLYSTANLDPDGFHPNDAGYAIIADKVISAVTSTSFPAPAGSCPQMTVIP